MMRPSTALCWILPLVLDPAPAAQLVDPDRDGDGLSDFQEVHKYGTDPESADSDGDGRPDGEWDERREFTYTITTVLRVLPPADVEAANDDFQDARLRSESGGYVELEVVHYPLNTVGGAIDGDRNWRRAARDFDDFVKSTTTSRWNKKMARQLARELRDAGVDVDEADDRTLALAAARRLMERSEFEDGFTTFLADYDGRKAVIPRELKQRAREDSRKAGRTVEEQWERELFADGMFEHRVHGSCTSSAIYLCGGLRAVGLPTRIVLVVPLVDANDPEEIAMIETGVRHHRVRATILKGIRPLVGSWASHTFNEVLVGGRWRRLNYTRLGQPTLDAGLYGLTTHILTVRDWADARMGRTVGRRQGLRQYDDEFGHANPYHTVALWDEFGQQAEIENPPYEEPRIDEVTFAEAYFVASEARPEWFEPSGVDLNEDRIHVVLAASKADAEGELDLLDDFFKRVPKDFELVGEDGERFAGRAVRGFWKGASVETGTYLFFLLRIDAGNRERMGPGPYAVVPTEPESGPRFRVREGLRLTVEE